MVDERNNDLEQLRNGAYDVGVDISEVRTRYSVSDIGNNIITAESEFRSEAFGSEHSTARA